MASRAIRAGDAFLELRVRDAAFNRGISNVVGRLNSLGAAMRRIGSLGFTGFSGFQRLLIGIAGSAAISFPIKLAANMELLTEQMAVFTGSTKSARDVLIDLQKFSAVAFQDVERLVVQMRLLLTRGIKAPEALKDIKAIATVAAGSAEEFEQLTKALADVASSTRLNGEEMRQFKNTAFNPFIEIAKRTGETFDQLRQRMEAGGISFAEVRRALRDTVSEGGLFHGMLELISETLIGQFRQGLSLFKLAILPLGEELLPALRGILNVINSLIPLMGEFVKQNAFLASVVAGALVGIVAFLGVLTSLGVTIQVTAFAMRGLLIAFTVLLNPITLTLAAITGLVVAFVKFTSIGQRMTRFLAGKFQELFRVAAETFSGIADALAAGEIQLAANVLWAGLRLAWLEGTQQLETAWINFKDLFLQTTLGIVFAAQEHFSKLSSAVRSIWAEMVTAARTAGEKIGHALTRSRDDPQLAAEQDRAHDQALARIRGEGQAEQQRIRQNRDKELAAIEAKRKASEENRNRQHAAELNAQRRELAQARKRFEAAGKAAAEARENIGKGDFDGDFEAALEGIAGGGGINGPRSVFGGQLGEQIFGAGGPSDEIPRKQLIELRKAARTLERIERKQAFKQRVGTA